MKFVTSCLKSKNCIVLDDSNSNQSQIQSQISDVDHPPLVKQPPNHYIKNRRVVPIRKVPITASKPNCSHKIEQIDISDNDQNSQYCQINQSAQINKEEKGAQVFKRRLIKVANKCKIQGKQYSSTECSICLDSLAGRDQNQIGRLQCKHAFCYDCIIESSKFSSRCPYCRTQYKRIQRDGEFIQIQQKDAEQDFDPYDEPCYVCGRNNDFDHLLECQYCQAAFCHTYCDNRLQSDVPPEQSWYCLSCSSLLGNG